MKSHSYSLTNAEASMSVLREMRSIITSDYLIEKIDSGQFKGMVERFETVADGERNSRSSDAWGLATDALRLLLAIHKCTQAAKDGSDELPVITKQIEVLNRVFTRNLSKSRIPNTASLTHAKSRLQASIDIDEDDLVELLLALPLPTVYSATKNPQSFESTSGESKSAAPATTPLLRVIAFLDKAAVASPQIIKPQVMYSVVFRVRGRAWPDNAVRLRIDLLTTVPGSEFAVSEFLADPPEVTEGQALNAELQGQLKFNSSQSSLMEDLVFRVRAAFVTIDGELRETSVIGHDELRLRVVDAAMNPLMTGNRSLDQHISELVTRLVTEHPSVQDELSNLLVVLQGLTRLLAAYAQEAIYKGRQDVRESEFQTQVLRDLRMQPEMGQEVHEATDQAGGETDIKFRDVTVELKVEKKNGDRNHLKKKYTKQPVQYAGVEAKQTSVLLVLDLTEKVQPPGDIRNDILLEKVKTHGDDDPAFPSYVFMFVMNGNLVNPSDYSR
ncbi:hypothetical protein Poly51_17640 [Rubripirellula tenax]|uniref:Uncharacterized protein n=1 Tax=Rubripirellula tenax TaxID=2528015 RepID=A0A5C6FAY7_9BACT|nr:hypothetical protein [Rubripirellula tenax]TWU58983.1 hypothetical protein Poly51_17640 [Rubripirellula tenax]